MKRSFHWLRTLVMMATLFVIATSAHAQTSTPPYHGFKYDSTFIFGAHVADFGGFSRCLHDTLHFTFKQTYAGPSNPDVDLGSAHWRTTIGERWVDSVIAASWDSMRVYGLKIIYAPWEFWGLAGSSSSLDYYFGTVKDTITSLDYRFRNLDTSYSHDTVHRNYMWGPTVPSASPHSDLLIAGRPRYTVSTLVFTDTGAYHHALSAYNG